VTNLILILLIYANDDEFFFSIEGIVNLAKKMLKTKNDSLERVFHIGIFIYQIVITFTSCNCYSEDSFLCDAYYQE